MMPENAPEKQCQTLLALVLSALGIVYFLFQVLGLGVIGLTTFIDGQIGNSQSYFRGLPVWSSVLLAGLLILWVCSNTLANGVVFYAADLGPDPGFHHFDVIVTFASDNKLQKCQTYNHHRRLLSPMNQYPGQNKGVKPLWRFTR